MQPSPILGAPLAHVASSHHTAGAKGRTFLSSQEVLLDGAEGGSPPPLFCFHGVYLYGYLLFRTHAICFSFIYSSKIKVPFKMHLCGQK